MTTGLSNLSAMEYPGRIIIIGRDLSQAHTVVVYAITGRSPSSQARKIEFEKGALWVKPTDEKILNQGDVDLLIYPAVQIGDGIAVSNGKQTPDIRQYLGTSLAPIGILSQALEKWDYEPDAPAYTPRISGCVCSREKAALSIIKRAANGASVKHFVEFPLEPGKGKLIATYSGENKNPLPSFTGEPLDVGLEAAEPGEVASSVYAALNSSQPELDFRVTVAVLFVPGSDWDKVKYAVINRQKKD